MTARELYSRAVQYMKSLNLPTEMERGLTFAIHVAQVRLSYLVDCMTPEDFIHTLVLVYLKARENIPSLDSALLNGDPGEENILKFVSEINKAFYNILKECGFRVISVLNYDIPREVQRALLDEYIENGRLSRETKKALRKYRRRTTKVVQMAPVSADEKLNFISEQEDEYAKPRRKYKKEV